MTVLCCGWLVLATRWCARFPPAGFGENDWQSFTRMVSQLQHRCWPFLHHFSAISSPFRNYLPPHTRRVMRSAQYPLLVWRLQSDGVSDSCLQAQVNGQRWGAITAWEELWEESARGGPTDRSTGVWNPPPNAAMPTFSGQQVGFMNSLGGMQQNTNARFLPNTLCKGLQLCYRDMFFLGFGDWVCRPGTGTQRL